MIELKNITKTYKVDEVLSDLNYVFEKGKFYALMGKSGVGKTTLINIISTLAAPTSGEVLIETRAVSALSNKEKALIRNKKIGFVFQSFMLLPQLNAVENIMLPMYLDKSMPVLTMKKRAENLMVRFDLGNKFERYPYELSAGEQQRVAIARALVNEPSIIIADEPTGNLDEENEAFVFQTLKALSLEGKLVLVVSHNKEIMNYSDINLSIKSGKLGEIYG
ncbi:ABC transporter ATP-binding protein [Fusibacter bizertensis]